VPTISLSIFMDF